MLLLLILLRWFSHKSKSDLPLKPRKTKNTPDGVFSTQLRKSQQAQTRLGLFGQVGEHHGDVVTGMFVAGTGNDHARAIHFAVPARRLQGESHLGPCRKTGHAAELDPIFVDDDRIRCEGKAGLPRFDGDVLQ